MQPARASALAAAVFASVGVLGGAAALTYAHQDSTAQPTAAAAHQHKKTDPHQHKKPDKKPDKQRDKAGHDSGRNGAKGNRDEASAAGRAHADAMKAWAHCVAQAAAGPKAGDSRVPPKSACGDKPAAPGQAKHGDQAKSESPGRSGHHKVPTAPDDNGSAAD